MIPYGHQLIDDADIEAVVAVLRSDFLTQGPAIERFENATLEYCGAGYAVAMSSATAALHLSCLALGVGPGDVLWTSPISFVASANCGLYCGAEVDFVDIDPLTFNMGVAQLEAKLQSAAEKDRLPKVVVTVDFGGQPVERAPIRELCDRYGVKIVEDASHAIGSRYRGTKIGKSDFADLTVFSFHPVKIITTGEGGMVVTDDEVLAQRVRILRTHGITRDPQLMTGKEKMPWEYEQIMLGYNYRLTDLQAVLGISQLTKIDAFLQRRREIAAEYDAAFAGLPMRSQHQHPDCESSYHLYPIWIDEQKAGVTRGSVYGHLRSRGVAANVLYIPIHTQPYYAALGFAAGDFPNAEGYYRGALALPMFPGLTDAQQSLVIEAVREALSS